MAITNTNILDYVLNNKVFQEDATYLLQDKKDTMGVDAVGSSFTWMYGRFFHGGRQEFFATWKKLLLTFDFTDLENLETITAVFKAADAVNYETYTMLFDALVNLTISNMYGDAGQDGEATVQKKEAQELIQAICGNDADPDTKVQDMDSIVKVASITTDYKTSIYGKY